MEKLKFVDIFAGVGGIRQGFEKNGHECIAFSEIDKYAIKAYKTMYGDDEIELGDVSQISDEELRKMYDETDIVVGGSPCFVAGTPVLTKEGYKPIEEVKKGDHVLTHTGSFQSVLMPMKRQAKGIYTIKTQGLPEVKATEEHPFLAVKKTRKYNSKTRNYEVFFSEEEWVLAKDLTKNHYIKIPVPKSNDNPLNITMQEAWLIGRYIADGHYDNRKRNGRINSYFHNVIFSVGYEKIDEFKREIDEYHVCWTDHRTVKRARIGSARLLGLIMRCGKGAFNKHIPVEFLSLPNNLLEEIIRGYMSGDGNYSRKRKLYSATTISPSLALSLSLAVNKTKSVYPSVTFYERAPTCVIEGRTVNQKGSWMVRWFDNPKKCYVHKNKIEETYTPVRKIDFDSSWEGEVFNIEVENDNSYTVNNLAVHNCQAFSVAGKKGGFEDTRGSLFFEYCRTIKHTQPKYFLFENVKGVLSHDKGRTIDTMIRSFNEVGYTVDLNLLNSKYFDVPQHRERIFVVGVRSDLIDHEEWIDLGKGVLGKARQHLKDSGDIKTFNFDWPKQESVNVKLREILENNVDEKYYVSEEKAAKLIAELNKGNIDNVESEDPIMLGKIEVNGHDYLKRVYSVNGVGNTLTTMQGGGQEPKIAEPHFEVRPTLTPERDERRQMGRRFKENDEPAFKLTALDRHGVAVGNYPHYRIRRLTPLETWRLQGFSDEDFFKVRNAGMSDSQLYKQAGNSVTINVIDALAKNINELHKTLSKRNIKVYNEEEVSV